jgi:hypothetical protein
MMRKLMMSALVGGCLAASAARAQSPNAPRVLRPVRYDLVIGVDLENQRIDGTARIRLRNENTQAAVEASVLLYRLLSVQGVRDAAGKPLAFTQGIVAFEDFSKLQVNQVRIPLVPALAPGKETTVEISYGGHVLGYAETGMAYVRDRVDSAYTLLREDAHAYPTVGYPSLRLRRAAGLPVYDYTARITVPSTHTVANGGQLVERVDHGATTTFVYRSVEPSWRMDFAIAPFRTIRRGKLTVFHLPADSVGALRIVDAMSRTLELYTRWFGPLREESPFAVIEIPDGWGSQADVTSILQAAAAFREPKREDELYHEISHLWNVTETDRPAARWNEGLATFLEDLTTDSLSARATTDSNAMRYARWLGDRARADSTLRSVAPVDYGKREMTGYSYSVGSVMFYGLYRLVGHDVFRGIIGDYYRAYVATGGTTADFVRIAKQRSPVDLDRYFADWLYSARWVDVVASAQSARDLYAGYHRSN